MFCSPHLEKVHTYLQYFGLLNLSVIYLNKYCITNLLLGVYLFNQL